MENHKRKSIGLLAIIPTMLLATSQLSASEVPEFAAEEFWFDTQGTLVDVVTPFEFESMELRIRKRGETEVWTETFGPGVSLSVDLAHIVESGLTDDRYTYEFRFVTGYQASDSASSGEAKAGEPMTFQTSGSFSVLDGSITDVSIPGYRSSDNSKGGTAPSNGSLEANNGATPMDVVDAGELAIGGWGVFGSSNTSDIVDGKLRILRDPTSGIASLSVQSEASNGDAYAWHFGTQDGGDFGLQRQRTTSGAKTTVLGIEEDAAENSLMIDSNGNIGLGTATPAEDLHIFGGDMRITDATPSILLDNTSGSTASYHLEESDNDFRIRQSAGTGAGTHLVVEEGGNIGMGTIVPAAALHVRTTDGTAQVRVEDTNGTTANRTLMDLRNNGSVFYVMRTGTETWTFSAQNGRFAINSGNLAGEINADFRTNGNLIIAGTLTENSSRSVKHDIQELEYSSILERLDQVPIAEWRYDSNPGSLHIGPMAEDWHEAFGLGLSNKGVAPRDLAGVALASAKALKAENNLLRKRLERLEAKISGNP